MDEGTGIVHMAPGLRRGRPAGLRGCRHRRSCAPVDDRARFTAEVPDFAGVQVFDANAGIVERLRSAGALLQVENYTHSYPHCWRTDTPLIYRAMSSWFVRVTAFRDRMVELNQQIRVGARARPRRRLRQVAGGGAGLVDHKESFLGDADTGVEERRSALSAHRRLRQPRRARGRFRRSPDRPAPPRPRRARRARTRMTRPDLPRCEGSPTSSTAGSSPDRCRSRSSTTPSRTTKRFEEHFPADFIVEYVGQTRGWFYTLHVLATALFDRPPFKTLHRARHRARRRRPQALQAAAQLPRSRGGLRGPRGRRHAVVPASARRCCGATTSSSRRRR